MISRNIITRLSIAALLLSAPASYAQDIHFTQFDMQPLVVNPAFTGMFYGKARADVIYRSQWNSVTTGYKTIGASVDMPIFSERSGDYLAAGLQMYKDQAGDGNLQNFTGLLSLSYHKLFGNGEDNKGADLAVGLQGGYAQKSIDLSKLYFGDEFVNGQFVPGTTQEYHLGLGNSVNYFLVNAGVSYAKSINQNFSFVLGLAANNLNQPNEALAKKQNSETGLDMRYTGELGMIINLNDKFSLRPAVMYQYQATASEIVAGNEFHYALDSKRTDIAFTPGIFLGGWYRTGDATMITAGVEFSNFRIGVAYDYNISTLNAASNGNGGFEIALRYIAPYGKRIPYRTIPCNRF